MERVHVRTRSGEKMRGCHINTLERSSGKSRAVSREKKIGGGFGNEVPNASRGVANGEGCPPSPAD